MLFGFHHHPQLHTLWRVLAFCSAITMHCLHCAPSCWAKFNNMSLRKLCWNCFRLLIRRTFSSIGWTLGFEKPTEVHPKQSRIISSPESIKREFMCRESTVQLAAHVCIRKADCGRKRKLFCLPDDISVEFREHSLELRKQRWERGRERIVLNAEASAHNGFIQTHKIHNRKLCFCVSGAASWTGAEDNYVFKALASHVIWRLLPTQDLRTHTHSRWYIDQSGMTQKSDFNFLVHSRTFRSMCSPLLP